MRAREKLLLIIADNDGLEEEQIKKAFSESHPDVSRSSPILIDQLVKTGQVERQTRDEDGEKVLLLTDEGEKKADELRREVVSTPVIEKPLEKPPTEIEEVIAVEGGAGITFNKLSFPATVITLYEFAKSAGHTKCDNFNDWLIECATLTFNQVYGCQIVMRGYAPVA